MRKTVLNAVVVTGALAAWLSGPARADDVLPTPVPPDIKVPEGNGAYLEAHAVGTQNYVCAPAGAGFAWKLFTPQATLVDREDEQIITHFFSPNPDPLENGTIRAAWQDSRDTSTFWGKLAKPPSLDPDFVEPGAIPWLLLSRAGVLAGPTGGDRLTKTTFVQRVHTSGGVAPPTGCASSPDVGETAFVPYSADYIFFKHAPN